MKFYHLTVALSSVWFSIVERTAAGSVDLRTSCRRFQPHHHRQFRSFPLDSFRIFTKKIFFHLTNLPLHFSNTLITDHRSSICCSARDKCLCVPQYSKMIDPLIDAFYSSKELKLAKNKLKREKSKIESEFSEK